MRRIFTITVLLTMAATLSACGGNSDTSGNAGRAETDTTVNSERIDSSNIAPTGGPGPEPESKGTQSSENANASTADNKNADNKNKAESKNKNTQ